MSPGPATPDPLGRRPTSRSRGRTHARIMALQHDPARLPGAEAIIGGAPDGSIAAGVSEFHQGWVISKPVTSRRSYERSLTMLLRDLDLDGPDPHGPLGALTTDRVARHLGWRIRSGLTDAGELRRCVVHLGRLSEWLAEAGRDVAPLDRAALKLAADVAIAAVPPPFHVATAASELRDTNDDESTLGH